MSAPFGPSKGPALRSDPAEHGLKALTGAVRSRNSFHHDGKGSSWSDIEGPQPSLEWRTVLEILGTPRPRSQRFGRARRRCRGLRRGRGRYCSFKRRASRTALNSASKGLMGQLLRVGGSVCQEPVVLLVPMRLAACLFLPSTEPFVSYPCASVLACQHEREHAVAGGRV